MRRNYLSKTKAIDSKIKDLREEILSGMAEMLLQSDRKNLRLQQDTINCVQFSPRIFTLCRMESVSIKKNGKLIFIGNVCRDLKEIGIEIDPNIIGIDWLVEIYHNVAMTLKDMPVLHSPSKGQKPEEAITVVCYGQCKTYRQKIEPN